MSDEVKTVQWTAAGINGFLAACLSWHMWRSFWWGLLHFLCGWFYLVYWLFAYGPFR